MNKLDEFVKKQVYHQYDKEMKTDNKRSLNFEPFIDDIKSLKEERYIQLEELIIEKSVLDIQKSISKNKLNYEELILFYLKRILEIDVDKLNSVIQLNPDALKLAKEADEKESTSSIFGIPVLIKDNIATGDGLFNTAGSVALKDFIPNTLSPIIEKLKTEGAIILGKANMSEWAFYMSSEGVCGYTALGGQCHNPYGKYGVGGSSSGSAAAVSGNLCCLSIGTETNGSLTYPSGQNSVVCIYPTRGVWSNKGIIPISESFDTPGPMARNVEDAGILLKSLSEVSEIKKLEVNKEFKKFRIGLLSDDGIKSSRRGGDDKLLEQISKELIEMEMEVVEVFAGEEGYNLKLDPIIEYEFNIGMKDYFKENKYMSYKGLEDIIAVYNKNPDSYGPYGYDLLSSSVNTKYTFEDVNILKKSNEDKAVNIISTLLKDVDMVMSLSSQFSNIYVSAGYPSISVPGGYRKSGEPFGITFTAGAYEEEKLIHLAKQYEDKYKKRKLIK